RPHQHWITSGTPRAIARNASRWAQNWPCCHGLPTIAPEDSIAAAIGEVRLRGIRSFPISCKKRWAFHNLNSADCRGSGISSIGVFLITQVHLANVRVQRRIARCPKQRAIMRVHISRITTKTFQIREQSAAIDSVAVQRLEHLDATIALDDQLSKVRLYVRVKFQRHELARFLREAVGCEPSV